MARHTGYRWVPVTTPEPGDIADHKGRTLDPRRVARVEGPFIWLDILGQTTGPLPKDAYTYGRWVEEEVAGR